MMLMMMHHGIILLTRITPVVDASSGNLRHGGERIFVLSLGGAVECCSFRTTSSEGMNKDVAVTGPDESLSCHCVLVG